VREDAASTPAPWLNALVWLSTATLGWAIVNSLRLNPGASPDQLFISELAVTWRPGSATLNGAIMACGGVGVIVLRARFWSRAQGLFERFTWWVAILTALLIVAVGYFPLPAMEIHNPLAGALLLCATLTSWLVARVLRLRQHEQAIACQGIACAQTLLIAGGIGYVTWVVAAAGGVAKVHTINVELAGRVVNPVAPLEWCFFALVIAQALCAAGPLLRRRLSAER
jgi:hypothetical membrane protein